MEKIVGSTLANGISYFFIPWDFFAEKMDWLPVAEHSWWGQLLCVWFSITVFYAMYVEFTIRVLGYPRPLATDTSSTSSTNYQQQKSNTQLYAELMDGVLKGNVAQVKKALDEGAKRDRYSKWILNKKDRGTTPLFSAVEGAKKEDDTFTEIAIMLLNAGADKNTTCFGYALLNGDCTAKDIAARNQNNKLLKALAASSLPRPVSARSAEKDKKKN